ncbi:WRKY transcription factor [Melia azedarach]|uniref:WRKY transcription factor n=1 Tax=Melia azedarach TaxID=155640 RepID=A0ACC1Z093_MELAZ|nr:WRKY transcription factor [Melia azedarach]
MDNSHSRTLLPDCSSRFLASHSSLNMGDLQLQAEVYGQSIANDEKKGCTADAAASRIQLFSADHSGSSCEFGSDRVIKQVKKEDNKGIRKHRFAFQTRSQVDILDDGYRWRKYGQKIVKNSKFPRSYYKCTQKGCNVKKQVQRNSKDEGIVVTTYEGIHTHPIGKLTDSFERILRQTYSTS